MIASPFLLLPPCRVVVCTCCSQFWIPAGGPKRSTVFKYLFAHTLPCTHWQARFNSSLWHEVDELSGYIEQIVDASPLLRKDELRVVQNSVGASSNSLTGGSELTGAIATAAGTCRCCAAYPAALLFASHMLFLGVCMSV